ncbi:MAG: GMC oxidoreductase, partial [Herbaspirillum sp.]
VRGQPRDYDQWEAAGAQNWNFSHIERYFRKLEQYILGGEYRGKDGPMHLEQVAERFPIASAFLDAAVEDGQKLNNDYNGKDQEGFGYYQVLQHQGRRWSVVDGYLKPALSRPNLTVVAEAQIQKLLFDGKRCTGLTYRKDGKMLTVNAGRETILCLGAIQSPQMLELSGVGNPELLRSFGLNVIHAQPNVGENYIDHFATRMNWRVKNTITLNEMSRGWRLGSQILNYYMNHRGILTLGTGLVHGFVKTDPNQPPDIQYFFIHASYANAAERILDKQPGMTIGVAQLRPQSVGSIHIKSANPCEAPAIRPNFLSHPLDEKCLIDGMQIARRIINRPAMSHYVTGELSPGATVTNFKEWSHFARQNGQTIYHPVGTCRMGSDSSAVVDSHLRVNGIERLRVVDASIMPKIISGNTQGAVMMIAEKGAAMILEDTVARQKNLA